MQEFPVGTKEYLIVNVTDKLGNLTSLVNVDATFDVHEKATGASKIAAHSASGDVNMNVACFIDTTGWDLAVYQLWVTLVSPPEYPRLGPFEFRVIN